MSLPSWAVAVITIGAAAILAVSIDYLISLLTRESFNPAGRNCFITGGSSGLGKALAEELVKGGADVCIVARRTEELEKAVKEIEQDMLRAFDTAEVKMGRNPDFVCCCAGASYPKFFLDSTLDEVDHLINLNYLGQAYAAHVIENGKIVFVSSMLGILSFAGYATYSPTKYAIRGLADTLRNELKQYGIGVHIFFPGGIESPGFDTENLTKPEVTKAIEGANTPQTSKECAKSLMKGLHTGNYMIMTDFIGEILRAVSRGVSPSNNFILDSILSIIGQPIASGYAIYMDYLVKSLNKPKTK
ncbi:hypothetical protein PHYBLDRAFT_38732 [Phycomyces blakesleeanus NRRL 1555(-)]|uniref:3-dehydrosphinganine reductase n=1 Tax=Phycomyces blakesleeanus (strain ATCC 8743b / DSM 1359 / FGSC 10004 / NBRC 33097 / NRRL 1555) TaxID=763407 RepID=A0A162PI35_PHYB8|nr:hypothetical protein PHYBLDRAFT_38732 [Phycomyces blakesleeanus NRRL 1555(-)]OAD73057.1 hypothetical protein PHYBLDRAFT_38732 [Phycomyces blakesleeanus NRRL 1555(-)]|eukprot:XP_018291097.1 hypothetical protein PHYBLDRAFT_38732 [Phycomyces blakesleeanus NRRL 1555(-)]